MRFLALTLLPTGELFDERFVDPDELDQSRLRDFTGLFASPKITSRIHVPGAHPLQAQSTASSAGMALGTLWLDDQVLHSTVMLAGRNPTAESAVLDMFYSSITRTPAVAELQGGNPRFDEFLLREERPVMLGVMWPIIPFEKYTPFAWSDIYLAAGFFRAIGVERNAG